MFLQSTLLWKIGRDTVKRLGLRDPLLQAIKVARGRKARARQVALYRRKERELERFGRRLDRKAASHEITAAVLTVDPSPFLERCLQAVRSQALPPSRVEIIRNVQPFSKASQTALERVQTRAYVSVDDDMILDPACFERLYWMMSSHIWCSEAVAKLRDPIQGPIEGIHMYRTEDVRAIGFHPFEGEKGCERYMEEKLRERGRITVKSEVVVGQHHPVYLPHEAYWRFRFAAETARCYPTGGKDFREDVDKVIQYWRRTGDETAFYALAGLFKGIHSEDAGRQLTYEGRTGDREFRMLHQFLLETKKDAEAMGWRPDRREEGRRHKRLERRHG